MYILALYLQGQDLHHPTTRAAILFHPTVRAHSAETIGDLPVKAKPGNVEVVSIYLCPNEPAKSPLDRLNDLICDVNNLIIAGNLNVRFTRLTNKPIRRRDHEIEILSSGLAPVSKPTYCDLILRPGPSIQTHMCSPSRETVNDYLHKICAVSGLQGPDRY